MTFSRTYWRRGLLWAVALSTAWAKEAETPILEEVAATAIADTSTGVTIAEARQITAEELHSPMMTDTRTVTDTSRFSLTDWCLDHLFLSSLLACLLSSGGVWLVYKLCSFFFISRRKS